MVIGIDASRAFVADRTGTENYSYHLINEILRLPESKKHTFVLFTRPKAIIPKEFDGCSNVIVKEVKLPYLWTQIGLAWETWKGQVIQYSGTPVLQCSSNSVLQNGHAGKRENRNTGLLKLDVLWIPAHTLPVLRNPKIKTVVTIHGLEYQWLPEYKNLLQRWYLPLSTFYAAWASDKLIAVSSFTAKQLQEQLRTRLASTSKGRKSRRADKKKIKVIHEGVCFGQSEYSVDQRVRKSEIRIYQELGIERKKYVLFVGSVQPRKNLVALIEAFSIFAKSNPDLSAQAGYKLVIAGGIGWMAESVFFAPGIWGVQEKVVFTGRVSQEVLQALYLGASLYVQPSITEGFGLPILEAMDAGIPVVSSDGGALGEVVGEAGIVVGISNLKSANSQIRATFPKRLAEAMERVVSDPALAAKMTAAGKKRVGGFSWTKAAAETLKVLLNPLY